MKKILILFVLFLLLGNIAVVAVDTTFSLETNNEQSNTSSSSSNVTFEKKRIEPEDFLTADNILIIILITIGIVIILLGIAILIRCK